MRLANKIAMITGGGRGIGSAVAFAFAREGADVALVARTETEVKRVASELESTYGVSAFGRTCDVSSAESVDQAMNEVVSTFGRGPDILVNNAGVAASAPLTRTTDELWNRVIGVNLTGTFNCTRAALPHMLERGWGRVINIASIAGKTGAPYIAAYTASKHGVVGFTRAVATEVATKGVTVNSICPGYVDTDMVRLAVDTITQKTGMDPDAALDTLKRMNPQQRLVTPDEVAAVAMLLVSDDGRGINGQAINIDGGAVFY
jgi:3-hydroxybutyrate dehydrogenase